jgi:hypothetical protein
MVFYTLDAIVRNYLLRKRHSIHFYLDGLVYSGACLRELTIDDLKVINTKRLPIDSNTSEVELPNDYVNYIDIGVAYGQRTTPLVEDTTMNSIPAYTSDFTQTTYDALDRVDTNGNALYYGYALPLLWNTVTWNEYGENIGRLFGWGQGSQPDTFTVIKEQNVIKINEDLVACDIIIRYVSDGQNADAASQIPAEAYDTINKYIGWQFKENSRSYSEGEKQRAKNEYLMARDVLRARMNDLTMEKIGRLFQQNYIAAPKS